MMHRKRKKKKKKKIKLSVTNNKFRFLHGEAYREFAQV